MNAQAERLGSKARCISVRSGDFRGNFGPRRKEKGKEVGVGLSTEGYCAWEEKAGMIDRGRDEKSKRELDAKGRNGHRTSGF